MSETIKVIISGHVDQGELIDVNMERKEIRVVLMPDLHEIVLKYDVDEGEYTTKIGRTRITVNDADVLLARQKQPTKTEVIHRSTVGRPSRLR